MSLSTSLLDCLLKSIIKTKQQHLSHFNVNIWLGVNMFYFLCIAIFTAIWSVFINTFDVLIGALPLNSELKSRFEANSLWRLLKPQQTKLSCICKTHLKCFESYDVWSTIQREVNSFFVVALQGEMSHFCDTSAWHQMEFQKWWLFSNRFQEHSPFLPLGGQIVCLKLPCCDWLVWRVCW